MQVEEDAMSPDGVAQTLRRMSHDKQGKAPNSKENKARTLVLKVMQSSRGALRRFKTTRE